MYSIHLDRGLNNLLVPSGPLLASPLGRALLNNSDPNNLSSPAGLTIHPTAWSARIQYSLTDLPIGPNFIRLFSTVQQSASGSTTPDFGGLPQNGPLGAGRESRPLQAVFWINVSASGNGVFANATVWNDGAFAAPAHQTPPAPPGGTGSARSSGTH